MPFPTDAPKAAFGNLLNALGPNTPDVDVLVLSAYDALGYALSLYFGDVKYPMALDIGKLLELAASPEFAAAKEAVATLVALKGSGGITFLVVLKLLIQYGPKIVALVLKLVELAK